MQKFVRATAAGLVLAAVSALSGCHSSPAPAATAAAPAAAAPVAAPAAAYVCPMGCEGSASNKPGKCPVCEMDLVPNPAAKADLPTDSI